VGRRRSPSCCEPLVPSSRPPAGSRGSGRRAFPRSLARERTALGLEGRSTHAWRPRREPRGCETTASTVLLLARSPAASSPAVCSFAGVTRPSLARGGCAGRWHTPFHTPGGYFRRPRVTQRADSRSGVHRVRGRPRSDRAPAADEGRAAAGRATGAGAPRCRSA
jgi:hypothetical protein